MNQIEEVVEEPESGVRARSLQRPGCHRAPQPGIGAQGGRLGGGSQGRAGRGASLLGAAAPEPSPLSPLLAQAGSPSLSLWWPRPTRVTYAGDDQQPGRTLPSRGQRRCPWPLSWEVSLHRCPTWGSPRLWAGSPRGRRGGEDSDPAPPARVRIGARAFLSSWLQPVSAEFLPQATPTVTTGMLDPELKSRPRPGLRAKGTGEGAWEPL